MTVHILVASSATINVELVKSAVALRDYIVIPASNMALALFLAHKNFPELIVSDLQLTDGSGLRFLTEVKDDPVLSLIPILFLIDQTDKARQMTFSPEPDGIIYCPIEPEDLFAKIDSYVQKRLRNKIQRMEESPE